MPEPPVGMEPPLWGTPHNTDHLTAITLPQQPWIRYCWAGVTIVVAKLRINWCWIEIELSVQVWVGRIYLSYSKVRYPPRTPCEIFSQILWNTLRNIVKYLKKYFTWSKHLVQAARRHRSSQGSTSSQLSRAGRHLPRPSRPLGRSKSKSKPKNLGLKSRWQYKYLLCIILLKL